MNHTDKLAKILWDYHSLNQIVVKADCIIALGSSDLRVAYRAADLFNEGYGNLLITTGGLGRITKAVWNIPEANKFADIAIKSGVPKDKIIIENKSSNTFENIRLVNMELNKRGYNFKSFLIVTKPYMERRAWAMLTKAWPKRSVIITSPQLSYEDYPTKDIPKNLFINMLVGDLQRIIIYSERNEIVPQKIPKTVMVAYNSLIKAGFNEQLINEKLLPKNK